MTIHLNIAKQFSETPGPRYCEEGEFSGEQFRNELLEPAFAKVRDSTNGKVIVDFDGTAGYATSFLEEAFGGLARIYEPSEVIKYIELVCTEEPGLVEEVGNYIKNARIKKFSR
jgi:hypothetical protein